jgi:hypothetical protein
MVSYGLSKDPTVLLTLGARMIREMRAHLEAEEQLLPLVRLRAIRQSHIH